ncbi:MAG: hypothetical protein IPK68_18095 [Bdellovibrionales bacterium]|nr:hypothetical protein [Bdellovibrionales bacterium]
MHFYFRMDALIIIFRLFQMMSAYLFVIRIFGQIQRQHFISEDALTKIGTSSYILILIIGALPLPNEMWRWLLLFSTLLFFYFSVQFVIFQREKSFQDKFIFCLDRLLILLRTGSGFRSAFDKIVEEEIGFNKAKLMQIRSSVVFSQHKNGLSFGNNWTETMRELQRAHTNSHESLRRIENLRRKMKMEREFRHKSGQILFQMRIQAWILAGLYLALLVHVLFRDGSQLHLRWIVLSFVMFIIGLLWTLNMGRRIKWKI